MTTAFKRMGKAPSSAIMQSLIPTKKEPLPLAIQLGTNALRFTDEGWQLESGEGKATQREVARMHSDVERLLHELELCKDKLRQVNEESNMVKFQNQLLLEMVAVSRVEQRHFKEALDYHEVKEGELGKELEHAYSKILGSSLE